MRANKGSDSAASAPSISSSFSLVARPPGAEKPPILPSAPVTRWQGTTIGQGLRPSAWPTARAWAGSPRRGRDRAIGRGGAGRDGPRVAIDGAVEVADVALVERQRGEIVGRAGEEGRDPGDRRARSPAGGVGPRQARESAGAGAAARPRRTPRAAARRRSRPRSRRCRSGRSRCRTMRIPAGPSPQPSRFPRRRSPSWLLPPRAAKGPAQPSEE